MTAYAWDHPSGGKGVSFSLNNVQLVREDERFDGRKKAEEMFGEVEVSDDDYGGGDGDYSGDEGSPIAGADLDRMFS